MVSIQSLAYSRSLSPWFVERPLFARIRPGVSFSYNLLHQPGACIPFQLHVHSLFSSIWKFTFNHLA